MRRLWLWVRWALAFAISVGAGGIGAVLGLYAGLYLRSLLVGVFLAWVGFTVAAYLTFLLVGVALRVNTASLALRR